MILTLEQNGRGYFLLLENLWQHAFCQTERWLFSTAKSITRVPCVLWFMIITVYCWIDFSSLDCDCTLYIRSCMAVLCWIDMFLSINCFLSLQPCVCCCTQILFKELRLSQPTWTNRWQDFGSRFLYSKLEDWISTESISSVSGFRFLHFQCCPLTFQSSTRCFQHWMMAGKHWFFFVCKPVPCSSRRSWWSTSTAWWSFVAGDCQRLPLKDLRQRYKKK